MGTPKDHLAVTPSKRSKKDGKRKSEFLTFVFCGSGWAYGAGSGDRLLKAEKMTHAPLLTSATLVVTSALLVTKFASY